MKVKNYFRFMMIGLAFFFVYSNCSAPTPDYSISFVTVREAAFRTGQIALPLDAEGKKTLLSFLERGGDQTRTDYVDAGASQFYDGLFDLLAQEDFLYAKNFRQEEKIDQVSDKLTQWFNKTIIYQLIDARQERPPVPSPICITDGQYWWIFYLQEMQPQGGEKRLKVKELLVTAPPSKYFKHYGKIKEDKPEKTYGKDSCTPPQVKGALPDVHDVFLRYLNKIADVYLVSKLKTEKLNFASRDVRVFIPDIHMLDRDREKKYSYHFNCYDLLVRLARQLREFKQLCVASNTACEVYQLGDFFDIWREIPDYLAHKKMDEELPTYIEKLEEDRYAIYKEMRHPDLNVQFILGNHDFDIHYIENYLNDELSYYLPGLEDNCPVAVTLHGDLFDIKERMIPETFKHFAVYYFGPYVKGHTIDIGQLREARIATHKGKDYQNFIQEAPQIHLENMKQVASNSMIPEDNFNVMEVGVTKDSNDLRFATQSREFIQMINEETGWDLRFVVIGHTHHARIVIDETGGDFSALIDCGAWIQRCEGEGYKGSMPSAQIGIIYNNEARIYQLAAKHPGSDCK